MKSLMNKTAMFAALSAPADLHRGAVIETKDDDPTPAPAPAPTLDSKEAIADFQKAWTTYQQKNDDRLTAIEKGLSDPIGEDELKKLDTMFDQFEGLNGKLTQFAKQAEEMKEVDKRFDKIEAALNRKAKGEELDKKDLNHINDWARAVVFAQTEGVANLSEEQKAALDRVADEYKALNVGTNTQGGYLAPIEQVREIIKGVTEISPVRSLARVRQTGMKAVDVPKRTGQFAAQWVSEQGTRSETTGLTYGTEEITVHEFYALIDITNQMLEDAMFDMEAEINEESVEQFALAEGAAFVNGSGVGQPEGFMTNASVGSDVSGTATTIADANGQADGLLTLKHNLKTAYTNNANWLMNRTVLGSVRKLKTGDNQYLWMPGVAMGKPNTIDGDTYVEMPDMPSEGAGAYPIAYGDFRRAYTWVDRIQTEMLRDPYTQATSGKIRFIMRRRVGGKVLLGEAIRKLQCSV